MPLKFICFNDLQLEKHDPSILCKQEGKFILSSFLQLLKVLLFNVNKFDDERSTLVRFWQFIKAHHSTSDKDLPKDKFFIFVL